MGKDKPFWRGKGGNCPSLPIFKWKKKALLVNLNEAIKVEFLFSPSSEPAQLPWFLFCYVSLILNWLTYRLISDSKACWITMLWNISVSSLGFYITFTVDL